MHSLIFSVAIIFKSKRKHFNQNISLALLLINFSLVILRGIYIGSGYYLKNPFFLFFPICFTYGVGVIFYIYTKFLFIKSYKFKGLEYIHLSSFILQFFYYLVFFIKPNTEKLEFFKTDYFNTIIFYEDIIGTLILGGYLTAADLVVRRYQNSNKHQYDKKLINWVKSFTITFMFIMLTWIMIQFDILDFTFRFKAYYFVYLLFTFLNYWTMYRGFINTERMQPKHNEKKDVHEILPKNTDYDIYLKRIQKAMNEDLIFLNSKLTLNEFGKHLEINPKYLSYILNNQFNKNFHDFINEYRIKQAKLELLTLKTKKLTIEAVSKNCGFNSKSTFNSCFKKITSYTPSQFIKKNSD
jgi:AraC-like DNA-binding protein